MSKKNDNKRNKISVSVTNDVEICRAATNTHACQNKKFAANWNRTAIYGVKKKILEKCMHILRRSFQMSEYLKIETNISK